MALNIPEKVDRHVLKAVDFLSRAGDKYVPIKEIRSRVRWSLGKTKPLKNVNALIKRSLKNQEHLGFIYRNGDTYSMAVTLEKRKKRPKVQQSRTAESTDDSHTSKEEAGVRSILRDGGKKSLLKKKKAEWKVIQKILQRHKYRKLRPSKRRVSSELDFVFAVPTSETFSQLFDD